MRQTKHQLLFLILCIVSVVGEAQDSSRVDKLISIPDKLFGSLDKRAASFEHKLNKQTDKYLDRLQRQENRLRRKLSKQNPTLAKQLFDNVDEKYEKLKQTSGKTNKYAAVYSGHLDTLSTALGFLKDQNLSSNPALQTSLLHYRDLQQRLNASDQIRQYLVERQQMLKQQFQQLGMIKELNKFRKDVYYYQQQLRGYKQMWEDPSKIEGRLIALVLRVPQFKDFFAKNSMLGSLFALPSSGNSLTASVSGLQTRQMLNQSLISRFGTAANINQQLSQNVQAGQAQLNTLKAKFASYSSGSYGNGDADIPGFKPNSQKTKSFFGRLEYGGNVQTQKARYFFPITSDVAVSLGYKLNDRSSLGVGASYKMGWGNNWNNLRISNQGVGLRSYMDWKIKGSFYVSGGYEQNYRNLINSVDQLRDYSAWQSSGLVGLSKKYQVSKKMKGEVRLLWDFLSYQQVPKAQPIVFRVGYSLK